MLLLYDGMSGQFRSIKLRGKNELCDICGPNATIKALIDYEGFCGANATDKVGMRAKSDHGHGADSLVVIQSMPMCC